MKPMVLSIIRLSGGSELQGRRSASEHDDSANHRLFQLGSPVSLLERARPHLMGRVRFLARIAFAHGAGAGSCLLTAASPSELDAIVRFIRAEGETPLAVLMREPYSTSAEILRPRVEGRARARIQAYPPRIARVRTAD